jgi:hypothetical protein
MGAGFAPALFFFAERAFAVGASVTINRALSFMASFALGWF